MSNKKDYQVDQITKEYGHWMPVFDEIFAAHAEKREVKDLREEIESAKLVDKSREPEKLRREQEALRERHERYPDGVPGSLLGRG